ncbi:MAG: tRNA lysidine(34) synthetase TilS [Smithella sp.]
MVKKVINTIKKHRLLKQKDKVIIGLSGGPDSTALTVILAQIRLAFNIQLIIAHFNHRLRSSESDRDEQEASRLAAQLNLPFISKKMNKTEVPKGISPEDFYRRERYQFFDEVAENYNANKIALGHNLQDQAETVLLHLLRGSGLDGLKGISPIRDGRFIRPLLEVSRQEIISYLDEAGINYQQDSSNSSFLYLRNKIRLELLPYLKKEFNPNIDETLAQMAEIIREENLFIKQSVSNALKSSFIIRHDNKNLLNINYLNTLPRSIKRRLIKELLESFGFQKNGITFLHIDSIDQLLQKSESGKQISLPGGIEARREYENLILEKVSFNSKPVEYSYKVEIPSATYVAQRNLMLNLRLVEKDKIDFSIKNKSYLDVDKIQFPLVLRNRRAGDQFQPLGMTGTQKLKSFFINQKITQKKRNEIMLLEDRVGITWIENMHLSDRVKITPETKNVLELEII